MNRYSFNTDEMKSGMLKDCYTLKESNGIGTISITLHGPVNQERDLAERRIARHRLDQLTYVRVKVERRVPREEEY